MVGLTAAGGTAGWLLVLDDRPESGVSIMSTSSPWLIIGRDATSAFSGDFPAAYVGVA